MPPPPDARLDLARRWLSEELRLGDFTLTPASSDASFRRYFRVSRDAGPLILMDAPPDREDSRPFLDLAARLATTGVTVPRVLAADLGYGLLLLTDFGDTHYLSALAGGAPPGRLYGDALDALLAMQTRLSTRGLAAYDERLLRVELGIFREWYLARHLGVALTPGQEQGLSAAEHALVSTALEQPRTFVHRDYHSRNLMVLAEGNPGVLDFQGALIGPVTYDLVSLLRDCYVAWPAEWVAETALVYQRRLEGAGVLPETDPSAPEGGRDFRPPAPSGRQAPLPGRHPAHPRLRAGGRGAAAGTGGLARHPRPRRRTFRVGGRGMSRPIQRRGAEAQRVFDLALSAPPCLCGSSECHES